MFTPTQVSEMLSIPTSTLRRYSNDFKKHLSTLASGGRIRRYTNEDIVILARARKLLKVGHSPDEVNTLLSIVEDNELAYEENDGLEFVPGIAEAIEALNSQARNIRNAVDDLADRQNVTDKTIENISKRLAELENREKRRGGKR